MKWLSYPLVFFCSMLLSSCWVPETVNLPDDEIVTVLELRGYHDVVLEKTVKNLGEGIFGPCRTFRAVSPNDEVVKGGYCTPQYMDQTINITYRGK